MQFNRVMDLKRCLKTKRKLLRHWLIPFQSVCFATAPAALMELKPDQVIYLFVLSDSFDELVDRRDQG